MMMMVYIKSRRWLSAIGHDATARNGNHGVLTAEIQRHHHHHNYDDDDHHHRYHQGGLSMILVLLKF